MTSAIELERAAAQQTIERLRADGWKVTAEPTPEQLPESLSQFRPDLLAQRGDEHALIQIRSRRNPPDLDMVTLAEKVAGLRGWRLDLVYLPENRPVASREQLLSWLRESVQLAESNPEAALLLAWSAAEGVMHRLAEPLGIDTDKPGALLAALVSLGLIFDEEHDHLRRGFEARNAVAHGREGPQITPALVAHLAAQVRSIDQRGSNTP